MQGFFGVKCKDRLGVQRTEKLKILTWAGTYEYNKYTGTKQKIKRYTHVLIQLSHCDDNMRML